MADLASYAATAATAQVQISTANTNRDGTGTLGTLISAAATGTRVDDIDICATVTTTAGVIRMFVSDGTNHRLVREILVPAITPSTTVEAFRFTLRNLAIILKSGWSLRFSTHNAEAFNVVATRAGDL